MNDIKNIVNIITISFYFFITSLNCIAQGIGNGEDGSPSISGIVNSYTYLLSNVSQCDYKLNVANASIFSHDNLIIVIQMQGAIIDSTNTSSYGTILEYGNTGNYEFAKVDAVNGNEITLKHSLLRDYEVEGNVQIIKVPQYKRPVINGILTCPEWNGKTGGIIAIDAQDTLIMNNHINVMGKGFRGGIVHDADHIFDIRYEYYAESPDPQFYALKGEGISFYGNTPFTSGRGAPANAGGGGNIHTTGGGGGANFGCGGDGGWGYPVDQSGGEQLVYGIGGHALPYSNTENKIFIGGGGGSGHEHFGNGTSGANGGGMVIITAKAIKGDGHYIFAGGNNSASGGAYGDGVGGGGAGGTVLLNIQNFITKVNVTINGGSGGSTIGQGFGPGGGGGGGVCWMSNLTVPDSVSIMMNGGINGLAGGTYYGGTSGCNGSILTDLQIPFDTIYEPIIVDFTMSPTFYSDDNIYFTNNTSISFNNSSTGANTSLWNFGDGFLASDTTKNPIYNYNSTGTYNIQLTISNGMCSDSVIKTISTDFNVPNFFTPNGDGINDFFPGIDFMYSYYVSVYNRWGNVVFNSNPSEVNWNGKHKGKDVTEGTYFYVIKYTNNEEEEFVLKGAITLLR